MSKFMRWLCPHTHNTDTGGQAALLEARDRLAREQERTTRAMVIRDELKHSREVNHYAAALRQLYGGQHG